MTSVNTNYGAMVALQQLNKTNNALEMTQSRINTGLKVSSAKDNGAIFAIAQGMRSDVAAYEGVQQSLDRSVSTVDTALARLALMATAELRLARLGTMPRAYYLLVLVMGISYSAGLSY